MFDASKASAFSVPEAFKASMSERVKALELEAFKASVSEASLSASKVSVPEASKAFVSDASNVVLRVLVLHVRVQNRQNIYMYLIIFFKLAS